MLGGDVPYPILAKPGYPAPRLSAGKDRDNRSARCRAAGHPAPSPTERLVRCSASADLQVVGSAGPDGPGAEGEGPRWAPATATAGSCLPAASSPRRSAPAPAPSAGGGSGGHAHAHAQALGGRDRRQAGQDRRRARALHRPRRGEGHQPPARGAGPVVVQCRRPAGADGPLRASMSRRSASTRSGTAPSATPRPS